MGARLFTPALCCLSLATLPAQALTRPVGKVAAAIRYVAPGLPRASVARYAEVIQSEAANRDFDPFTLIAIVRNESRFHAGATHPTGVYIGLGQHSLYRWQVCDPKRGGDLMSVGCQAQKARLLDGVFNLRLTAEVITANRQFCRRITGHPALFARWLSSYQGFNNRAGRLGVWCNMKKDDRGRWRDVPVPGLTLKVMFYQKHLAREFG